MQLLQLVEDHKFSFEYLYSISIVCNISKVILIDNLSGYYFKGKLHIFVTVHCCVAINVWHICTQKSGVRCRHGAVDEGFICCDIYCGSCEFTRVFKYISSNSESCYVVFIFLMFDVTYYSSICPFWSCETCDFGIKKILFYPENLFPTPCTIIPN